MDQLNPIHFACYGYEKDAVEFSTEDRQLIAAIRMVWPEIDDRDDFPIRLA